VFISFDSIPSFIIGNGLQLTNFSPDDNRFDLRPFLYPPLYSSYASKKIDEMLDKIEKRAEKKGRQ
jgi:NAD+ synthase (glutamine-hydrolysing)